MAILRLRTENKRQMVGVLCEAGLLPNEDGELITATHDYFVSMCGVLYKETGIMLVDEDGNEYAEKLVIDGYHANLITYNNSIIAGVAEITVIPTRKLIKIAGELD